MPRVTDAHRRARRDEIADAALRVLQRRGVGNTSIAQIVAESGLSAGAIYANFENKAELARTIAESLLSWRVDLVAQGSDTLRTPLEVLGTLLATIDDEAPPLGLVVQFWGEATLDPDLLAVLTERLAVLRGALERAVLPWARTREPASADALAARTATALIVAAQGYLANAATLGWTTPEAYLSSLAALLD